MCQTPNANPTISMAPKKESSPPWEVEIFRLGGYFLSGSYHCHDLNKKQLDSDASQVANRQLENAAKSSREQPRYALKRLMALFTLVNAWRISSQLPWAL
jgi:hypothetical protein